MNEIKVLSGEELCVSNTWFKRESEEGDIQNEHETEIDFVLIKKEHRRSMQNVNVIHEEFQHALVVADIDKKKIRNIV